MGWPGINLFFLLSCKFVFVDLILFVYFILFVFVSAKVVGLGFICTCVKHINPIHIELLGALTYWGGG